jgi:antitoxin (DNA-binding transcriptional repressor) of toxin-antitoxin stability system
MASLLGYGDAAGLNRAWPARIAMTASDPVIEQIAAYPWPRGGLQARRVKGGYTLTSARTGAPVARLKPLPSDDRVEVHCGGVTPGAPPGRSASSCPSPTPSPSSQRNRRSGSAPDLPTP